MPSRMLRAPLPLASGVPSPGLDGWLDVRLLACTTHSVAPPAAGELLRSLDPALAGVGSRLSALRLA